MAGYNITEIIQPVPTVSVNNDIPVFIGKSSQHFKDAVNFTDNTYLNVSLDIGVSDVALNVNIVVSYWRDVITPISSVGLSNGQTFIPLNSPVLVSLDKTKFLFALIDNSGTLLFSSTIKNVVFSKDMLTIVSISLNTPIALSTQTKACIVGISQESIPYTYVPASRTYVLNYNPIPSVVSLLVNESLSASYVDYDLLNTFNFLTIDKINDTPDITESNQDILRGINSCNQCIIIPAHSDNDISNVIQTLKMFTAGYYITPIGMSDAFNLQIYNFVKSNNSSRPYSAILPTAITTQVALISGVTYVKS